MTVIGGSRRLSDDGLQCHSVMFRVQHTFTAGKIFNVKIQLMKSVTAVCSLQVSGNMQSKVLGRSM